MISLAEIIIRLRDQCPSFQQRVGGTATFAAVTDKEVSADLAVPNCFVIPMREDNITGMEEYIGNERERRREFFATVVCVDNTVPGAVGMAGVMKLDALNQLRTLQHEIEKAFDQWVPQQRFDAIQFVSGRHVTLNSKRMWHQWEWSTDYWITPALSDAQNEALEQQVRDITENNPPREGSPIDTIDHIYAGWTPGRWVDDPATVASFFKQPPVVEPTPERLETAQAAADADIPVPPPLIPPPID